MVDEIRSAEELVKRVAIEPGLEEQIRHAPLESLRLLATEVTRDIPKRPMDTDPWIYRIIVLFLGLVIFSTVLGCILLSMRQVNVPETLTALGSAAVGALAGLLAPTPGRG